MKICSGAEIWAITYHLTSSQKNSIRSYCCTKTLFHGKNRDFGILMHDPRVKGHTFLVGGHDFESIVIIIFLALKSYNFHILNMVILHVNIACTLICPHIHKVRPKKLLLGTKMSILLSSTIKIMQKIGGITKFYWSNTHVCTFSSK